MNKKKRLANTHRHTEKVHHSVCAMCGERQAHFCPPGFGSPGFFICEVQPKRLVSLKTE